MITILQGEPFWHSEGFWAAVAALGGLLSAVAAFLTIRQATAARRYEVRVRRAYLRAVDNKMDCSEEGMVKLPLKLINVGGHPAGDVSGQILFINRESETPVMADRTFRLSNDFAHQAEFTFNIPARVERGAVVPKQFIMLALRYRDVILAETFEQFFYFTWEGCPGGTASEVVSHWEASREDAEKFFDKEIKRFSFSTQQAGAAAPFKLRKGRLEQCRGCQSIVEESAAACGNCGAETRAALMKRAAVASVVIVGLLALSLILLSLLR
jgi:hypothetical protein